MLPALPCCSLSLLLPALLQLLLLCCSCSAAVRRHGVWWDTTAIAWSVFGIIAAV